jgi:hypothetical protein
MPPGEIMGRVHIADRSDKASSTKGIDAWIFQATIMSLALRYQSIDHLQAN